MVPRERIGSVVGYRERSLLRRRHGSTSTPPRARGARGNEVEGLVWDARVRLRFARARAPPLRGLPRVCRSARATRGRLGARGADDACARRAEERRKVVVAAHRVRHGRPRAARGKEGWRHGFPALALRPGHHTDRRGLGDRGRGRAVRLWHARLRTGPHDQGRGHLPPRHRPGRRG